MRSLCLGVNFTAFAKVLIADKIVTIYATRDRYMYVHGML